MNAPPLITHIVDFFPELILALVILAKVFDEVRLDFVRGPIRRYPRLARRVLYMLLGLGAVGVIGLVWVYSWATHNQLVVAKWLLRLVEPHQ